MRPRKTHEKKNHFSSFFRDEWPGPFHHELLINHHVFSKMAVLQFLTSSFVAVGTIMQGQFCGLQLVSVLNPFRILCSSLCLTLSDFV